jgi:hypothetical protein
MEKGDFPGGRRAGHGRWQIVLLRVLNESGLAAGQN